MAPRLRLIDIALFERPMRFSHPFRFGAVTVDAAPQAFVRVEIEVEGLGRSTGVSAEMMMPKWFDKRPNLSPADTIDELRLALLTARDLYVAGGIDTAFGLHAAAYDTQIARCAGKGIPPLAAAFGPAEIDKAVLDALLRAAGVGFFEGMARNIAGLDARLTPDLDDGAITGFLAATQPAQDVAIRHTVGLDDALDGSQGLAALAARDALRFFKLKLGGDVTKDAGRLASIGKVLAGIPDSVVTLDANEQYADPEALRELVARLATPALAPIASRLLYLEQPMPRDLTERISLAGWSGPPLIIDEADDGYDAFPAARTLGYRGVSSKACKGLYKSVLNAVRARAWSGEGQRCFVSGEDLTCQAGLAVQQDLALVALLGLGHVERNGHHYVDGFGGAPAAEQDAFLAAHPDLYARGDAGVRLATATGRLSTRSLRGPGFAAGAMPDWASLAAFSVPATPTFHEHRLQES
jgi:hypothetical protein